MAMWVRLSVAVLVVFGLGFGAGCERPERGLGFRILFEDSRGLAPGAPVVYRGLQLGAVESVGLENGLVAVDVRIDEVHAPNICEGANFLIRTQDAGSPTRPAVEMLPRTGPCEELAAGATIQGSENRLESWFRSFFDSGEDAAREWSQSSAAQSVRDSASDLALRAEIISRDLEAFSDSPESERLRDLAEELASRASDLARRGEAELRKKLPELEGEFDALLRRLQKDMHRAR